MNHRVKRRILKKRESRFEAFFYKAYKRTLDRHDRFGRFPNGEVHRFDTVYRLERESRIPEDPPHVIMPAEGPEAGRWIRLPRKGKSS